MLDTKNPLIAEFLKDHQQFSRLIYEISNLLETNKFEKARERAKELDAVAGPHIAYEEAELYPRLAALGENATLEETLVGQHHEALDALRDLLNIANPNEEQLESIKAGFRDSLTHAEHCGSLISLVTQLEASEQSESLDVLRRLRKQGKNWTDL